MELLHRHHELHLRHTFRLARGATDSRHNLIVELVHDHLAGLGEAAPIARYGQDVHSATRAAYEMVPQLGDVQDFDRVAEVAVAGQPAATAAIDMALRDLAGKHTMTPLYKMLNVDPNQTPLTSFTIGMDTPEIVAEKVQEASGFEVLKVKMGSDDDRQVLEAVRDVTDRPLWVDANEGWTLDEALERLEWLKSMGVELVEQPLPADQLDEMRRLKRLSPLPLFADESLHVAGDIPRLADAFHGINIKLMKCGGIGEALRMIEAARAHGLKIMLGCMIETSLGITAAAHLSPLVDYADLDGNLLITNDPFVGATIERGRLVLPSGPGLGIMARGYA